ncbi:DUF6207 family protein [Streptomyces acidicola]|uniref:DUF6207 family protein n=1 Tax=Streptomyces acidicola TaxID=2596892 RepID=UPI003440310F
MRQINDAHVALPGLAVLEVAAADDETAFAIQELLVAPCAIASADRTTREPDEPGLRLRFFLDLRQAPARRPVASFAFSRSVCRWVSAAVGDQRARR